MDSFPSAGHLLAGFFILKIALAAVLLAFCGWIAWAINVSGSTIRDDIALSVPNHAFPHPGETPLRVAVISDLHVADSAQSYDALRTLVQDVLESEPSFILLLGDYTEHPDSIASLSQHAARVGELLGQMSHVPTIAVLGNYENWSAPGLWTHSLIANGIRVLRNEVALIESGDQAACFRGLGDAFSGQLRYVDFMEECRGRPKITLTHDPAGAFHHKVKGVVLAGHTHCGQIRLPLIGSPWIPSNAPNGATCGLYEDADRLLWVSSGVGTSILPIRFGTLSQWNLIEMGAPSCPGGFCPGALNTWHQNELCIPELRMTTVK